MKQNDDTNGKSQQQTPNHSLSKLQAEFLTKMLPKGYSLQPLSVHIVHPRVHTNSPLKLRGTSKKTTELPTNVVNNNNHYYNRSQDSFYECQQLLNKIKNHPNSWVSKTLGDDAKSPIPQQSLVRQRYVDLVQIENKLKNNKYTHIQQFHKQIETIFFSSYRTSSSKSMKYMKTLELQLFYRQNLRQNNFPIKEKESLTPSKKKVNDVISQQQEIHKDLINTIKKLQEGLISIKAYKEVNVQSKPLKKKKIQQKPITLLQKKNIINKINQLSLQQFNCILRILFQDPNTNYIKPNTIQGEWTKNYSRKYKDFFINAILFHNIISIVNHKLIYQFIHRLTLIHRVLNRNPIRPKVTIEDLIYSDLTFFDIYYVLDQIIYEQYEEKNIIYDKVNKLSLFIGYYYLSY